MPHKLSANRTSERINPSEPSPKEPGTDAPAENDRGAERIRRILGETLAARL